jgi:hypothetical protein
VCAKGFNNFSLGVAEGEDQNHGEIPTLVIVRCREPVDWLYKLGCVVAAGQFPHTALLGCVRVDGSSPAPHGRCEEVNVVVYNKCEPLENMTTRPCVTLVDQSHDAEASRLRNHGSYLDYILEYYGR